jgi:hypothetical protein
MKKIITIMISIILLTGCAMTKENKVTTSYGTYKLDKLVKNIEHSTNDTTFYTLEEDKDKDLPDNISVNSGTNYYKVEEQEKFKEAILEQLGMQKNLIDTLNSSGFTTDKGYPAYKFVITNQKLTATQYYIVGDNKFVLVYESNYTGNKEIDKQAEYIVNTFEWNE